MRIAIIGGSGLIGRSLYHAIQRDGSHDPIVYDIKRHPAIPPSDFRPFDVTEETWSNDFLEGCEIVYYKTGAMGPDRSFEAPIRFYDLNTRGFLRVIEQCIDRNVKQIVLDSTESVFGPDNSPPFREYDSPSPLSVYGASKRISEQYLEYIAATSSIAALSFRYPRVVAPNNHTVIHTLIRKVRESAPITITAGGAKRFDLVYLNDVVRWNMWAIDHRYSGHLHVTSGLLTSAEEITHRIAERVMGVDRYPYLSVENTATTNDTLLPDVSQLDNRYSLNATGLDLEYTSLYDFIELAR